MKTFAYQTLLHRRDFIGFPERKMKDFSVCVEDLLLLLFVLLLFTFTGLLRRVLQELLLQFFAKITLLLQIVFELVDHRLLLSDGLLQMFTFVLFLLQSDLNLSSEITGIVQFLRQFVPLLVVVPLFQEKVIIFQLTTVTLFRGDVFVQLFQLFLEVEILLVQLFGLELPVDQLLL